MIWHIVSDYFFNRAGTRFILKRDCGVGKSSLKITPVSKSLDIILQSELHHLKEIIGINRYIPGKRNPMLYKSWMDRNITITLRNMFMLKG